MITLEQVNKENVLTKENIDLIKVKFDTPKKDITLRNKFIKKLEVLYECRNLLETNPNAAYLERERMRLNKKLDFYNVMLLPMELGDVKDLEQIKRIKKEFNKKYEVPLIKFQVETITYILGAKSNL